MDDSGPSMVRVRPLLDCDCAAVGSAPLSASASECIATRPGAGTELAVLVILEVFIVHLLGVFPIGGFRPVLSEEDRRVLDLVFCLCAGPGYVGFEEARAAVHFLDRSRQR